MIKQKDLDDQLCRDGFLLLDADLHSEVAILQDYIQQGFSWPRDGFYYSLLSNSPDINKDLNGFIHKTLEGFYERYFTDYKVMTGSFLVKPARTHEELYLHQDWCYTDETSYNAYNIWIPMDDVTSQKGALFFVPGSHLCFQNLRSGSLPTARISYTDIPADRLKTVEVKRGQAVLFHPAVFHGSMPNTSAGDRVIVTATVFDRAAPFLYFDKKADDTVNVYNLSEDAFLTSLGSMAYGGKPETPLVETRSYRHKVISSGDLSRAAC